MIQSMRDELTRVGFQELTTAREVEGALPAAVGTTVVFVNSMCGCAGGIARPGMALALQHGAKVDNLYTVFAGQDKEATEKARSYFAPFPPSSPSIAIMKDGKLQQCDQPEVVYRYPANKFVAGFIGSPPMNFVDATIRDGKLDAGDFKLPLPAGHPASALEGKAVTLGIRPESIFDKNLESHIKATSENTISAKVDVLEPLGHEYVAYLNIGGPEAPRGVVGPFLWPGHSCRLAVARGDPIGDPLLNLTRNPTDGFSADLHRLGKKAARHQIVNVGFA
jgi:putative YphP/YqiW family bacilliredoxin